MEDTTPSLKDRIERLRASLGISPDEPLITPQPLPETWDEIHVRTLVGDRDLITRDDGFSR